MEKSPPSPISVDVFDERPGDFPAIRVVQREAFAHDGEARLVDDLRANRRLTISLVARMDTAGVVGHVAFSPVDLLELPAGITTAAPFGLGLAPLAVRPSFQRLGVGAALVRRGIERCRALGGRYVVVLGDPSYYPRFGFMNAKAMFQLRNDYNAERAFMALELESGVLGSCAGALVRYAPEFAALNDE